MALLIGVPLSTNQRAAGHFQTEAESFWDASVRFTQHLQSE